jgi:hemolysin activation/secretion protein
VYVFADHAQTWNRDPQQQPADFHLTSEGLGARYKAGGLLAEVDGARADNRGYVTRAGSYSVQFRVVYSW